MYPNSLDNLPTGSNTQTKLFAGVGHYEHHNSLANSTNAIEAKVGINNSAVTTTLDYALRTGWIYVPSTETWTYNSFAASSGSAAGGTLLVNADIRGRYMIGDKLMFTNNSNIIYASISALPTYSSPNSTVTYVVDSAVTVANSAFTNLFFSKSVSPTGFPPYLTWIPSFTGFSANPSSVLATFAIKSRTCEISVNMGTGTSNATGFTISAPITTANLSGNTWSNSILYTDNSSIGSALGHVYIASNSSSFTLEKTPGTSTSWTNSGAKAAYFQIFYYI